MDYNAEGLRKLLCAAHLDERGAALAVSATTHYMEEQGLNWDAVTDVKITAHSKFVDWCVSSGDKHIAMTRMIASWARGI